MSEQTQQLQTSEITGNDFVQELYADGVAYSFLGVPHSKITFYSAIGLNPDGTELRKATFRVTIPTNALLEMCRNTLAHASTNKEMLKTGYEHLKNFSDIMLEGISVTPAPAVAPPDLPK